MWWICLGFKTRPVAVLMDSNNVLADKDLFLSRAGEYLLEILGYITLAIFLGLMLLTLFGYIRTPVQTVLVFSTVLCLIVGGLFRYFYSGWNAVVLLPNEFLGGIILHPITALLTGLFLAGGLKASGGFDALKVILKYLRKSPIGLIGTLVILINLPVISLV
jgi:hypothetical protein